MFKDIYTVFMYYNFIIYLFIITLNNQILIEVKNKSFLRKLKINLCKNIPVKVYNL